MSFKLIVVQEIGRGEIRVKGATSEYDIKGGPTVARWLRKFVTFDWRNPSQAFEAKMADSSFSGNIYLNIIIQFMRNIVILIALAFICFYVAIRRMIHPVRKDNKILSKLKTGHKFRK